MLPPEILQIHRDRLKPGSESAYSRVETRIAERCAELSCPHPYLCIESLTGPREVWFFNGYESEEEKTSVADAYARYAPLMEALSELGKQKQAFIEEPVSAFGRYRRDLSAGEPWAPGRGRFLVICVSSEETRRSGTVFEEADGTRYIIAAFRTRDEAEKNAAGGDANVFEVRPAWSHPAKAWISGDPELWRGHPTEERRLPPGRR